MTIPFESVQGREYVGDFWNYSDQFSNGFTNNKHMITDDDFARLRNIQNQQAQQDPNYSNLTQIVLDTSMNYNGTQFGSSNSNTGHEQYMTTNANLNADPGFRGEEPTTFIENMFESDQCSLPMNANIATLIRSPHLKKISKRKRTTRTQHKKKPALPTEEENNFIQQLRAQNLPWKKISELFFQRFGKVMSNASLQMRMLRRRKKVGTWEDQDLQLLHEACDYYDNRKYSIIANKLQELGASQMYSARQVELQLQQLKKT